MIKNYLKIAWRNIKQDKLFTSIKIGGFAVGIAACLLIALFIRDELSYDQHYKNTDHISRAFMQGVRDGEVIKSAHLQLPFSEVMKSNFPEVMDAGKLNTSELFGAGKKSIRLTDEIQNNFENGFVFADQAMLDILEVSFEEGSIKDALTKPQSVVMSRTKADKYFPHGNAVGKTVVLDNDTNRPYTVTGVIPDFPKNSHLQFDFLLSIEDTNRSWLNTNYFTYVLLDKNTDAGALERKMHTIVENYFMPAWLETGRTGSFMEVLKTIEYKLQPIKDIHLKTDPEIKDKLEHGDIRFVWLFGAIAGFILLLASINFINLSTAKSANRAKEVGLRKTVGAFKTDLVSQFLTESVLFSVISFILGTLLAWLLLPTFNSIADKNIGMPWGAGWFFPILVLSALLIGIMAGLYPAFYLSSFRPMNVLKGKLTIGSKSGSLRSGLVVFQFATSVVLIIGTLVIYKQMDYIFHKELGYDKEQIIILEGTSILGNKAENFKDQLLNLSGVLQVTDSDYLPVEGRMRNGNTFKINNDNGNLVPAQIWRIDHDYIKTMGMRIKQGRDFSREFASDSISSIIINAKMAHEMGLENPLGAHLDNGRDWIVVGVMEDFHFKSLKEDIAPLALVIGGSSNTISIKIAGAAMDRTLAEITGLWDKNVPAQTFHYTFLDQDFAKMYAGVQRMGKIFNSFALFAIFVACLGLFALSAFMVEQRKKEISIRLVLGAPFKSIYELLTLDFLRLILMAVLIAIPIGWYMMDRWLEDFAYRITIGWEIFLVAGGIALLIALLTISYQSIVAALASPIKSLRAE